MLENAGSLAVGSAGVTAMAVTGVSVTGGGGWVVLLLFTVDSPALSTDLGRQQMLKEKFFE